MVEQPGTVKMAIDRGGGKGACHMLHVTHGARNLSISDDNRKKKRGGVHTWIHFRYSASSTRESDSAMRGKCTNTILASHTHNMGEGKTKNERNGVTNRFLILIVYRVQVNAIQGTVWHDLDPCMCQKWFVRWGKE